MRLFVAISLPDYVKDSAMQIRKSIEANLSPDIKWVEYENYHLTLKFLGEIERSKLDIIENVLKEVGSNTGTFELSLQSPGCFPNPKKPRVLFLGIGGQIEQASRLGMKIDNGLKVLGFEADLKRRFHLTLGRFRRNDADIWSVLNQMEDIINRTPFHVAEFVLMESTLSRKGPTYTVIKKFKLNDEIT